MTGQNQQGAPGKKPALLAVLAVALSCVGIATISFFWSDSMPAGIVAYQLDDIDVVGISDPALVKDFGVVAGYLLLFLGCGVLAGLLSVSPAGKNVARVTLGAAFVTAFSDALENAFLLAGLRLPAAVAATVKWCALPVALVLVLLAAFLGCRWVVNQIIDRVSSRAASRKGVSPPSSAKEGRQPKKPPPGWNEVTAPTAARPGAARWSAAYSVPDAEEGGSALCLSGGGVRSACVAMGAMQTLSTEEAPFGARPRRRFLDSFDYIISVSGGGYSAGAMLLASEPSKDQVTGSRRSDLSARLAQGSVEFEHLRRHSSYIADSPTALVTALAVVLKNLLLSLMTLFAPAVAVGAVLGLALYEIPVAAFVPVPPENASGRRLELEELTYKSWALEDHHATAWLAIGSVALLGLLCIAASVASEILGVGDLSWRVRDRATTCAQYLFVLATVVLVLTVGLPALMRLCGALVSPESGFEVPAVGVTAVALQYFAVLAAMVWRKKQWLPRIVNAIKKSPARVPSAVPGGIVPIITMALTLLVLLLAWLFTLGSVAAVVFITAADQPHKPADPLPDPWPVARWILFGAVPVVVFTGFLDVTSISLHPFYRRRLASAFAVRSIGGIAESYEPNEPTWLDWYARGESAPNQPRLVFAAAATISGKQDKPPPGLNAVSFTLSGDYIGGPDLGWVKTAKLWEISSNRIRRDLTVQAAVAVSGAAFASAMGRQGKGFQALLTASGARLGTWLPNPSYIETHAGDSKWLRLDMPRVRGSSYFYRELFGINPKTDRLVQVTDGGHYENLGLVEALRRKCRLIVCIDGSGDPPPHLSTLAEAIRLAKYELGVEIDLGNNGEYPSDNVAPGSAPFASGSEYEALNTRISRSSVTTARIRYPDAPSALVADVDGYQGLLVFAKATLVQSCPQWLLTYAANNPVFPHDSTSDQWFTEAQFAAYTTLGRLIAKEACEAIAQTPIPVARP